GMVWLAPSLVTWAGGGQLATPDSASSQAKPTCTSVRFQPLAFGGGATRGRITGGVLSRLTFVPALALLPARSTTVPTRGWEAPAWVSTKEAGQEATPERASAQLKATETSVLFQPAALGGGVVDIASTGGVLSMFSRSAGVARLPALSAPRPGTG